MTPEYVLIQSLLPNVKAVYNGIYLILSGLISPYVVHSLHTPFIEEISDLQSFAIHSTNPVLFMLGDNRLTRAP